MDDRSDFRSVVIAALRAYLRFEDDSGDAKR